MVLHSAPTLLSVSVTQTPSTCPEFVKRSIAANLASIRSLRRVRSYAAVYATPWPAGDHQSRSRHPLRIAFETRAAWPT